MPRSGRGELDGRNRGEDGTAEGRPTKVARRGPGCRGREPMFTTTGTHGERPARRTGREEGTRLSTEATSRPEPRDNKARKRRASPAMRRESGRPPSDAGRAR